METKKREFIDPNDLMRYINENHCYAGLPMAAHICTMELLTYAPRVDAVEVVHGRWIDVNGFTFMPLPKGHRWCYCSECRNEIVSIPPNYCDNCGAKMDGGN